MKSEAAISFGFSSLAASSGTPQTLGVAFLVNIAGIAAGTGTATIKTWDDLGNETDFDVVAGNPLGPVKKVWVARYQLTGPSTVNVTAQFSWPSEPNPTALLVSEPVSISGTVKTDVGQGTQIAGGTTLQYGGAAIDPRNIRALASTDLPGKSWSLGSGDAPSRSWTLGTADTPTVYGSSGAAFLQDSGNRLIHKTQGNETVVETEGSNVNIGSNSNGTITAGTTTLPIGTRVTFTMGICGALGTNTDYITIYLVGHTSGKFYAMMAGPGNVSGEFTMPEAETLDINFVNTDTIAHRAVIAWQGTNP